MVSHVFLVLEVNGDLGAGLAIEALRFPFGEHVQYVLWQAGAGVMNCMIACRAFNNLLAPRCVFPTDGAEINDVLWIGGLRGIMVGYRIMYFHRLRVVREQYLVVLCCFDAHIRFGERFFRRFTRVVE